MSTWESEMTKEEWEGIMGVPYSHISPEEQQKNREFNLGEQINIPLTEQEYIDKLGLHCPNCFETSGVVAWDLAEVEGTGAWQNVSCSLCEADWIDNYTLVGYSRLEVPEKEDTTPIQHPPNQQVAENWARIESERMNKKEIK